MGHQKYPSKLEIHPGTSCSLNCSFCYNKRKCYGTQRPLITENCLARLIDEFAALGGQELYISGGFEPFSQARLASLAILCGHKADLRVRVYTNGFAQALAELSIRKLLASKTEQVRFSIHAIRLETYRQITRTPARSTDLQRVFEMKWLNLASNKSLPIHNNQS